MAPLGYDHPLYILAFDHRSSLQKGLLGLTGDPTPEEAARISDIKAVIYDGFHAAIAAGVRPGEAAILVDEQFGAPIARAAAARREVFAMTVEKSGGDELACEYGDDFPKARPSTGACQAAHEARPPPDPGYWPGPGA